MIRLTLAIFLLCTMVSQSSAASLSIQVNPTSSTTTFLARPEQCVSIYTLANGNPACQPLYDANDNPVNGGPVADSNSATWISKQGSTPDLTDIGASAYTNQGAANYGMDIGQSMFYNPNGAGSISTTGMVYYALTCNNAAYSCGHSWSGAKLYVPPGARAQNPNSDHHISVMGIPCDSNGVSSPANKPPYTYNSTHRCELDDWLAQPGYPTIVPSSNITGTALTVEGEGQCDEDAPLGWYNCSGSTASDLPEGLNMNPADLVAAIQANTYLPYAIQTAIVCTENSYEEPSAYFDGYETPNGCPPNGMRYWSDITDAQVNASTWSPAKKAIYKTLHHYGGIVFDTTGGYGSGFSVQMIGGSGFTVGNGSSDTDANDPIKWLYDTANGGSGVQSISNDDAGSLQGLDINLSLAGTSYSVTNNFHVCKFMGSVNTEYTTVASLPKTCGNI